MCASRIYLAVFVLLEATLPNNKSECRLGRGELQQSWHPAKPGQGMAPPRLVGGGEGWGLVFQWEEHRYLINCCTVSSV